MLPRADGQARTRPDSGGPDFVGELFPFCDAPLDASTIRLAFTVQDALGASRFDRLMLASAVQAGCRYFLTEDIQAGRDFEGLRTVNPFQTSLDQILN